MVFFEWGVNLVVTSKLKISGQIPRIDKILSSFPIYDYNIDDKKKFLILEVAMPSKAGINEAIRRLSAKKNRRSTRVEIISERRGRLYDQ